MPSANARPANGAGGGASESRRRRLRARGIARRRAVQRQWWQTGMAKRIADRRCLSSNVPYVPARKAARFPALACPGSHVLGPARSGGWTVRWTVDPPEGGGQARCVQGGGACACPARRRGAGQRLAAQSSSRLHHGAGARIASAPATNRVRKAGTSGAWLILGYGVQSVELCTYGGTDTRACKRRLNEAVICIQVCSRFVP